MDHDQVLLVAIRVRMMTITTRRTNEMTEAGALVGLLLATALFVWDVYVADSLKRSAREKRGSIWSMPKSDSLSYNSF